MSIQSRMSRQINGSQNDSRVNSIKEMACRSRYANARIKFVAEKYCTMEARAAIPSTVLHQYRIISFYISNSLAQETGSYINLAYHSRNFCVTLQLLTQVLYRLIHRLERGIHFSCFKSENILERKAEWFKEDYTFTSIGNSFTLFFFLPTQQCILQVQHIFFTWKSIYRYNLRASNLLVILLADIHEYKKKRINDDSLHQFTNQSFFYYFIVIHFYIEYLKELIYAKRYIYIFFINRENGRVEKRRNEIE